MSNTRIGGLTNYNSMVRRGMMGYKLNSQLAEWLRENPHLNQKQPKPKTALVYRATKWRLRDRLTDRDALRLIMAFKTGMATKVLAEHFGINMKSVRKLLRETGVRRRLGWGQE